VADPVVRITVEDVAIGEAQTYEIGAGDYFIVTTLPATDSVVMHANGTHVITVRGVRRSEREQPEDQGSGGVW
jgi:hypothetical protein